MTIYQKVVPALFLIAIIATTGALSLVIYAEAPWSRDKQLDRMEAVRGYVTECLATALTALVVAFGFIAYLLFIA